LGWGVFFCVGYGDVDVPDLVFLDYLQEGLNELEKNQDSEG